MTIVLSILVGIVVGSIFTWLIAKYKFKSEVGITKDEIERLYILKEIYQRLENELSEAKKEANKKIDEVKTLSNDKSRQEEIIKNLGQKLQDQKTELEKLNDKLTTEFENIANRVLKEKSDQFVETNQSSLETLLDPLKKDIKDFRSRVDVIYDQDSQGRTALKTQIENLIDLNKKISDEANNLATALKGDSKTQGNWGESRLEVILERIGLQKGTHYTKQESFEGEDGGRLQPDFIINLPEKKHLIIDSKVSLVALDRYFHAKSDEEKKKFAKEHLDSIENHIKELSKKNYQSLYQINPPDCVLMFVGLESAVALASEEDPEISLKAHDRNIMLVTGSTLLATLRIVAYIWKQENQKTHVMEIAKQGGGLYDKFVSFVEDLKKVGFNLDLAVRAHTDAMNKLTESSKKGDTLVGRAEKIRELGAKTTKLLPQDIIDKAKAEV